MTSYYKQASMSGLILQFAYTYTDDNRLKLNNFKEMEALANHLRRQDIVEKFAVYADKHGLKRRNLMIQKSHDLLERYINSRIIYNMLDEEAWNEYINLFDHVIKEAMKVFKNNAAFPQKPADNAGQASKQKVASLDNSYHRWSVSRDQRLMANKA